jgi:hypothetical protein
MRQSPFSICASAQRSLSRAAEERCVCHMLAMACELTDLLCQNRNIDWYCAV